MNRNNSTNKIGVNPNQFIIKHRNGSMDLNKQQSQQSNSQLKRSDSLNRQSDNQFR